MRTILFFSILVYLTGCYQRPTDFDMRPVFIKDTTDPQLPVYSELGYNTFGAYYNDTAWYSDSKLTSFPDAIGAARRDDSLLIILTGSQQALANERLTFLITRIKTDSVAELSILNNTAFDLTGGIVKIKVNRELLHVESGTLNIKRSRSLLTDNVFNGMILSGTFDITGSTATRHIALREGRFDIILTDEKLRKGWFEF